ncbi:sigma-54-dependent Fis family transcriptional regulator [Mycobacterium paraintracellulare]|uniref:sigma-54-dependent Fis family transcriptional regulator n=1 Tax=Mycobacterium paraintracellulare TaxID=1138383 RepID=UPI001EEDDC0A|nr:helix-turn-helix domain-containing protein [Mycobacterium paraintracellulare]
MVKKIDDIVGAQRAREEFLSVGALDTDAVAAGVLSSWRRSRDLHVHPDRVELPYVRDPDTDTPLTHAAAPVMRRIAADLSAQAVSIVLSSADGLVLDRITADAQIQRALDNVRLARGYSYAEQFAGTNGIGTSLETGKPVFIQGSEHYVGTLGKLACAGSPIRDPATGKVLGVIDLTCWARHADPLLLVLAKSAGSQIEDRLSAMNNETETALLDVYLTQTRRYPAGVLAIGGEVVLMNVYLRQALDSSDQSALLDHAIEMAKATFKSTAVATLPSGVAVKITAAERIAARVRGDSVVFHVAVHTAERVPAPNTARLIPRLVGRSGSWRRSCHQVERCYRDRDWVVIEGESGSGRSRIGQCVAQHVTPERTVRILRAESFAGSDEFVAEFDAETNSDDFAVVIANVDQLDEEALQPLAGGLQSCAGRGWVAATMSTETRSALVDLLILPFFTHTVSVPPLRHRIEDIDDLVPVLLDELTRGADIRMDSEAMRQLSKLPWPGNVAQLRSVLSATIARQRSGVITADKLPAACRSLVRRKLTQLEALERDAIVRSLAESGGNKDHAARALGMSRATIYRKIKDFGII